MDFHRKKIEDEIFRFKQNEFEENHYIPSEVERIKFPPSSEIKELLFLFFVLIGVFKVVRDLKISRRRELEILKKKFYELSKKYVFKAIEEATNDVLQKMIQKIKEEKKKIFLLEMVHG